MTVQVTEKESEENNVVQNIHYDQFLLTFQKMFQQMQRTEVFLRKMIDKMPDQESSTGEAL